MSRVAAGRDEGNGLVLDPKQVSNDLVPSLEVPTIKIVVSTSSSILDDVFAVPEEIETSLTVFPSKRGGKNAAYCGHIFNFFHQSSKTIKWRCKNRKNLRCPAVLTTAVDFTFVVVTPTHNHPPDHDKVRSTVLTRTIYDASLVNPDKKPAELVEQFLSANPCTSALPMIASMRQTIWHHRKRNGALTDTKHLEGAEPISKPVITAGVNFGTVLRSTTEGDVRLAQVYSKNLKKRRSSEPCNEDAKGDSLLLGKANCIKSRSTKIFSVALTTSSEGSTDALHATATVSTREQRLQKRRSRELKSQGLPNTPRFSTSTEDVKCQIKSMSNLSGLLNENHSNANQPELREPADATQISAIMAGSDNEMSESKLSNQCHMSTLSIDDCSAPLKKMETEICPLLDQERPRNLPNEPSIGQTGRLLQFAKLTPQPLPKTHLNKRTDALKNRRKSANPRKRLLDSEVRSSVIINESTIC